MIKPCTPCIHYIQHGNRSFSVHQFNLQLVVKLLGKLSEVSHVQNKSFSFSGVSCFSFFCSLFSFHPSLHSILLSCLHSIEIVSHSNQSVNGFPLQLALSFLLHDCISAPILQCIAKSMCGWLYTCGCKYILLLFFSLCDNVISIGSGLCYQRECGEVKFCEEWNRSYDFILHNWMAALNWSVVLNNLRHTKRLWVVHRIGNVSNRQSVYQTMTFSTEMTLSVWALKSFRMVSSYWPWCNNGTVCLSRVHYIKAVRNDSLMNIRIAESWGF